MIVRNHSQDGLTLPELLVSLTVISTLSVTGISQFRHTLQENRMAAEVNQFITALHLARSEAVKHGTRILLCPGREGSPCGSSTDWVNGWILFASEDREHDPDERVLQAGNPLSAGISLRSSNHRKRIVYQQDGSSGGSNTSFTFCDTRRQAKPRVICLSNTGRPRLTLTRCDGKSIDC
ncbi:MAG: GspH/FimT family pseudopilin [Gammaproteobacteria bacterium]